MLKSARFLAFSYINIFDRLSLILRQNCYLLTINMFGFSKKLPTKNPIKKPTSSLSERAQEGRQVGIAL